MAERDRTMPDLGFGTDPDPVDPPTPAAPQAPGDDLPADGLPAEDYTLEHRLTPAERLFARIGHRGFSRPRVAVSARIFERYRVVDPWDPDPTKPEDPIALGPVSLKLGERRQVAPHLRPPARKKKKTQAQRAREGSWRPRVPDASGSRPSPKPQARPTPPPRPAEPSALAQEFGARSDRQPLRKPIPMRPNLAAPGGATESDATPASPPESSVARRVPKVPRAASSRSQGGRFRMKSTETSGPVVKAVRDLGSVSADEAAASTEAAPEAAPRPPMPPMGDSLDNLFGMAAMAGRMTLGSSKKKAEPSEDGDD